MTIQEMAQVVLGVETDDHTELVEATEVETSTFEAYRDSYALVRAVCKGCHGG